MKVTLVLLRTDAEFRCNFWAAKKCQRIGLCLVPFWQGAEEHDSLFFSFAENLHRKPLRKLKLFSFFLVCILAVHWTEKGSLFIPLCENWWSILAKCFWLPWWRTFFIRLFSAFLVQIGSVLGSMISQWQQPNLFNVLVHSIPKG